MIEDRETKREVLAALIQLVLVFKYSVSPVTAADSAGLAVTQADALLDALEKPRIQPPTK